MKNFTTEMKAELMAIDHITMALALKDHEKGTSLFNEKSAEFKNRYEVDIIEVFGTIGETRRLVQSFEGEPTIQVFRPILGKDKTTTLKQFVEIWDHHVMEIMSIGSDMHDWAQIEKTKEQYHFMATKRFFFCFLKEQEKASRAIASQSQQG